VTRAINSAYLRYPDGGEVGKLDIPVNIYCAYATMVKGARKAVVVLGTSKAGARRVALSGERSSPRSGSQIG
jgi:hypothetical protein